MYDSDPMRAISARVPTEPLSPARAALADAIERLAAASARMEVAQSALVGVERPPASMSSRDAGELRADMTRLHEITNWLGARAGGERPPLSAELKEAEAWWGGIAGTIGGQRRGYRRPRGIMPTPRMPRGPPARPKTVH